MKNEINLLSPAQIDRAKTSGALRILRIAAICCLFALLAISVILFFLSRALSPVAIKEKENDALYSLSLLHKREAKLVVINDRIKDLPNIIQSRSNFDVSINAILQKIPEGVSVNSMTIGKDKIELTVSSSSLLSINNLMNSLIDMAKNKKIIKNVTIDSLAVDVKGNGYSLSIKGDTL
ncbi:MAG: hypothetical protein M1372_00300 [Patescibacteria group bacterium]|nr:hypothetical protein [Patescibacteria group bacterium]